MNARRRWNRLVAPAAVAALVAWAAWMEVRYRDAEARLRQTQHWALYTGDLAVRRNNEIVGLRRRVEKLESRRPILPPVGDWEGLLRP